MAAAADRRENLDFDLGVELRQARDALPEPVDVFAWDYDWYELDFATMYANAADVDLRPHLVLGEDEPHRVDRDAVDVPTPTGTPVPVGHPIDSSRSFVGVIHYGANPGLG